MMRLFTIGFTKKKAREFFGLLSDSGGQGFSNSPRRSKIPYQPTVVVPPHVRALSESVRALMVRGPRPDQLVPGTRSPLS